MLSGEPGIGKSRLADALRKNVGSDSHWYLHCQCSPYHVSSPLYPVVQELERAANINPTESRTEKATKLESLLTQTSQVDAASLFSDLLSIDELNRDEISSEEKRVATLNALTTRLEGLAQRRAVVLVFEDLHWADPTTLEFLYYRISRTRR